MVGGEAGEAVGEEASRRVPIRFDLQNVGERDERRAAGSSGGGVSREETRLSTPPAKWVRGSGRLAWREVGNRIPPRTKEQTGRAFAFLLLDVEGR